MFALPPAFLAPAAPATDPSFASVVLLLHADGTNGSTTFTDNSGAPLTVTANGNAQLSTTDPKFGTAAGLFDGTGDYLVAGAAADWTFLHNKSTAYTLEAWVQANNFSAERAIFDTTAGTTAQAGIYLSVNTTRGITFLMSRAVGGTNIVSAVAAAAYPNDTNWHHIAVVYDPALGSGHYKLFVDGVLTQSDNQTGSSANTSAPLQALQIGRFAGGTVTWNGKKDDIRITKVARYTATFTPPSAPFPNA